MKKETSERKDKSPAIDRYIVKQPPAALRERIRQLRVEIKRLELCLEFSEYTGRDEDSAGTARTLRSVSGAE